MAISSVRQGTVSGELQDLAFALLARDRIPVDALKSRRTALTQKSSILSTLKTRLTSLRLELDSLAQIGTLSPFSAKAAAASDTNVLTASASASAANAALSITVSQLAKRATHVSDRFTDTGTVISDGGTGTFNFTITIGGTAFATSVAIGAGETDKTVLDNIVTAINTAVGSKGSAVRISPQTGQSRLSVSSADTGTANKITFTDTDGLLTRIGLAKATPTAATAITGGYVFEDLGNNELNATLVVDGLTYFRDSNTVTDLITGVTLNLKATSATAVTVKIQPDADKALEKLKSFITKYNEAIDYVNQQTAVDAKAGVRGALVGDTTFSRLRVELRMKAATIVSSQAAGTPNSLGALGIRQAADGKLSISDETKLRDTFVANPAAVQSLFNAADGVAKTLKTYVEGFTSSGGTIVASQSGITTRTTGLSGQITRMEATLAKKQRALEQQLARQQALLNNLSRQQSQIQSFFALGF
ncbi:MAG: flagellar filament capping protein FliD [Candidatus Rokubacteria bacterium]|nr:flagellar filament capping protein FliD [Candidatus Rokubacteria bacterium]